VSASIDTNIIVRHLTGDPPKTAQRATKILASQPDLLLAEAPRARVAEALRSLLAFDSIVCVDAPLLLRALEVYERDRLDFAAAYLVACAESTDIRRVASFDRSIDRVRTVERLAPR
jgi:predicted nucleic acid-binding protein